MNPVGRPSKYCEELANAICDGIKLGKGLRAICKEINIDVGVVFDWMRAHSEFNQQYVQAREVQAELMADELNEIADDGTNDWMEIQRKNGTTAVVCVQENIQRSRLRVDTRKWIAARLLPKKYGDKVSAEVSGKDGGPITFTLRRVGTQGE
jgi:hypothetical protein